MTTENTKNTGGYKRIDRIPVEEQTLDSFRKQALRRFIHDFAQTLPGNKALCFEFKKLFDDKKWIFMAGDLAYVNDIVAVMPHLTNYQPIYIQREDEIYDTSVISKMKFWKLDADLPTINEAKKLFIENRNYYLDSNGSIQHRIGNNRGLSCWTTEGQPGYLYLYKGSYKGTHKEHGNRTDGDYMVSIPISRLKDRDSQPASPAQAILLWLQHDLVPLDQHFASKAIQTEFQQMKDCYAKCGTYLMPGEDSIVLDEEKLFADVVGGARPDFLNLTEDIFTTTVVNADAEFEQKLEHELLNCDNQRAKLDPYDIKILSDPNRGHWDLWEWQPDGEPAGEAILSKQLVARNPVEDVNLDGIVAIDFGTKSTVVVFENEHSQTLPLQVGRGSYGDGARLENYENPTVIQFIDIESFRKAWKAREGRPRTSWEQVTVSHTAMSNMKNSKSELYSSFFTDIKRWCGNAGERVRLQDNQGKDIELPPYVELTEGDIDPIEIYAYYLGIYINNMLQQKHIFFKYIMSFPVTYERGVREHMRRSFERGLKKSLPASLLADENIMSQFKVWEGESEPAAYAITALQEYGFDPDDGEENYYAVFDFGGGTTDFDFGVLRPSELDRYDYTLLHFGESGDRHMGGENLLRMLAFNVFKANQLRLLKDQTQDGSAPTREVIPFTWSSEKMDFPGSVALIRDSREAHANMYNLMEKLRPVWEAPLSGEAQKILDRNEIEVDLFTADGSKLTNFSLDLGINGPEESCPAASNASGPEQSSRELKLKKELEEKENELKKCHEVLEASESDLSVLDRLGLKEKITHLEIVINQLKKAILQASISGFGAEDVAQPAGQKEAAAVEPHPLIAQLNMRIDACVWNFFQAMRNAFAKNAGNEDTRISPLDQVETISVFLAGNSSKSVLLKAILDKYLANDASVARQALGLADTAKIPAFVIYPPLGTDEAYTKLEALHQERPDLVEKPVRGQLDKPTGKTGVAFGLLRCREGGLYQVLNLTTPTHSRTPFQFYVGRNKKRRFRTIIERGAGTDTWHEFIDAAGSFDIFYSDLPEAAFDQMGVEKAKRITIHVEKPNPMATVFMRPCGHNCLEYAIATSLEELENGNNGQEPGRVVLG